MEEAKRAIFECMELFYNRKRNLSALGYLSPLEYKKLNLSK
ncbi:IS3 family transposase [uncultured Tissierella sp.]